MVLGDRPAPARRTHLRTDRTAVWNNGTATRKRGSSSVALEDNGDAWGSAQGQGLCNCHVEGFSLCFYGQVSMKEGHGGAGVVLHGGKTGLYWEGSRYLGDGIDRQLANYEALLDGLKVARCFGAEELCVRPRSSVTAIEISNGFRVSSSAGSTLAGVQHQVMELAAGMKEVSFHDGCDTCEARAFALADLAIDVREYRSASGSQPRFLRDLPDAAQGDLRSKSGSAVENVMSDERMGDESGEPHFRKGARFLDDRVSSRRETAKGKRAVLDTNIEVIAKCGICLEEYTGHVMFRILGCSHQFCRPCMRTYSEVEVKARQLRISCPVVGCDTALSIDECRQLLSPSSFDALLQQQAESSISESEKIYCPFSDCSALMVRNSPSSDMAASSSQTGTVGLSTEAECMECHRLLCVECRVPWHVGMNCEEYAALPADMRNAQDAQLYRLAQDQKWKRCAKCLQMIELADGCYHMTCRCGHEFCYVCAAPWQNKLPTCDCGLWDDGFLLRFANEGREMIPERLEAEIAELEDAVEQLERSALSLFPEEDGEDDSDEEQEGLDEDDEDDEDHEDAQEVEKAEDEEVEEDVEREDSIDVPETDFRTGEARNWEEEDAAPGEEAYDMEDVDEPDDLEIGANIWGEMGSDDNEDQEDDLGESTDDYHDEDHEANRVVGFPEDVHDSVSFTTEEPEVEGGEEVGLSGEEEDWGEHTDWREIVEEEYGRGTEDGDCSGDGEQSDFLGQGAMDDFDGGVDYSNLKGAGGGSDVESCNEILDGDRGLSAPHEADVYEEYEDDEGSYDDGQGDGLGKGEDSDEDDEEDVEDDDIFGDDDFDDDGRDFDGDFESADDGNGEEDSDDDGDDDGGDGDDGGDEEGDGEGDDGNVDSDGSDDDSD